MNLIVDIGNTSAKLALYKGKEKIFLSRINDLNCIEIENILANNKVQRAIVSSVKNLPAFVSDMLFHKIDNVLVLSHKTRLPFIIDYETPETLGTDRIAAVAGAYELFPGSEVLIIDAGTAITYDFLSAGIYRGGNISPGLTMRFRALNYFTGRLPLVEVSDKYSDPARSTHEAIRAGVINGVLYEINEYIRTFEKKHTEFKILFTGGDSRYLIEKNNYQTIHSPDIVIDGLNYILEYNAK